MARHLLVKWLFRELRAILERIERLIDALLQDTHAEIIVTFKIGDKTLPSVDISIADNQSVTGTVAPNDSNGNPVAAAPVWSLTDADGTLVMTPSVDGFSAVFNTTGKDSVGPAASGTVTSGALTPATFTIDVLPAAVGGGLVLTFSAPVPNPVSAAARTAAVVRRPVR